MTEHRYLVALWSLLLACGSALPGSEVAGRGRLFEVGPGKPYRTLQEITHLVGPGDEVKLHAQAEPYPGGVLFKKNGSAQRKITIRGVPVDGRRPVIAGGLWTLMLMGDHYLLEGLDITRGKEVCVLNAADDITIRDTVVHDCPRRGVLGADQGSGSLTLDHVEVHHAGFEDKMHPVYVATDESAHPGAVFRMQFCYLHDQNGGNNVKSRAERNEIYYNWIEGGFYRELELIGADGQEPNLAREDSDVVGNVLVNNKGTFVVRIGGDGTGDTGGRYRFINNTIVAGSSRAVLQAFDRVESLELSNNAFSNLSEALPLLDDSKAKWTGGKQTVSGRNNWIPVGVTNAPAGLSATASGNIAGFVDVNRWDLRPRDGSPLVDAGATPVLVPAFHPPRRRIDPANVTETRRQLGPIDIGAYELVSSPSP